MTNYLLARSHAFWPAQCSGETTIIVLCYRGKRPVQIIGEYSAKKNSFSMVGEKVSLYLSLQLSKFSLMGKKLSKFTLFGENCQNLHY